MRKASKILISLLSVSLMLGSSCFALDQITKINDLIENTMTYDGKNVTVEGEAIGEALERGDYVWVNINDASNATGIWMKKSDCEKIHSYGDYKHIGDTVKVTGVFHRACAQHGGDVDIHCSDIEISRQGYTVHRSLSTGKIVAAFCFVFTAAVLMLKYFRFWRKTGHSVKELH